MHSNTNVCFSSADLIKHSCSGCKADSFPLFISICSPDWKLRLELQSDVAGLLRLRQAITDCLDANDPARRVDPSTLPVPAEAATGAVVDADELLETMASSYDVRRGPWEVGR